MQNVEPASIDYAGDIFPPIQRGRVAKNGGRATIMEWDKDKRRFVQVDALTAASSSDPQASGSQARLTLTGVSQRLREGGIAGDDAIVTVTATRIPGTCVDC